MSRVFTGSKGSLKFNGVKVAYIGSINGTIENTLTDVDVLDQLEIAEAAETGHKANFTCNYFKVDTNSAQALGLETQNISDMLSQAEFEAEVYDSVGDSGGAKSPKIQISFSRVKWEGGSFTLDARGVFTGTFNFKAVTGKGL